MSRGVKRTALVPKAALVLGELVSKADLLEAAWYLAALSVPLLRDATEKASLKRLLEQLNLHRSERGQRPIRIEQIAREGGPR